VGTVTFLFTDIEGSTTLLQRLGDSAYAQVLSGHHAVIRAGLEAHGGREVDTAGDGFFAVFSSPRACVAAVLEMQQKLRAHGWPAGERVRVRMGVHTGDAAQTGTGLVGLDVHRAARVAAVGYGGQVLLSESAAVLARDGLPAGTGLTDLGAHQLKDLGRPERIFQLTGPGLAAEFPPLRSLGNPALQHNLPAQLTPFVGRDRELQQVRGLVESSRLVTLTGAGGSGKTRLALHVAAELLDGSGDGVWLVELAGVSTEDAVASAIGEALRIPGRRGRVMADVLAAALSPQEILIVLDNCEHLVGACAKITDALLRRCPRVRVLATSREPLGIDGEVIYRVPSLSLPADGAAADETTLRSFDAVALFAARSAAHGVSLSLEAQDGGLVVSVCRRLDGMPLAIELAAARLSSMSLAELHDRLDQRFRLLTGGSRTALERQQTLRATVTWSYDLLTGSEQVLLRRLSVFAYSFNLAAAEAVCGFGGIDSLDIADLLGSLVDKSLVNAEQGPQAGRYRLLETIRQFAAEQLGARGQGEATAVARAHCQHYLAVAEAAAPHISGGQGGWFARLDADRANLRLAVSHAAADPDRTSQVLRFGVALRRYWNASARAESAAQLLPVLARPEARSDPRLYAAALTAATVAATAVSTAASEHIGKQAVEAARQLGDDVLLGDALVALGTTYFHAGRVDLGMPLAREAAERARSSDDDLLLARSLFCCLLFAELIDPAESAQLFAEAMACTGRSGDELTKYYLLTNASNRALRAGDSAATRAYVEQALDVAHNVGLSGFDMQIQMAWVLRAEQKPVEARSLLETALRTSQRTSERLGIAYGILGLALVAADTQHWQLSAELHGAAQAAIDRKGQPWQEIEARYREESLQRVRAALTTDEFDRAYANGMALSPDAAISLALRQQAPA